MQVVLPREADPAVHLYRLAGHRAEGIAATRLGPRRGQRGVFHPVGERPRGVIRRGLRAFDRDQHVGASVLHGLEDADRAAELLTHLGVLHAHVQHLLRAAAHLGAQRDLGPIEHVRQHRPSLTGRAEHRLVADLHAIEPDLAQPAGLVQRLEQPRFHAGPGAVHDEQRDAVGRTRRADDVIRGMGVGHEQLDAVQHVAAAVPVRGEPDAVLVPAGGCFQQRQGELGPARGHAGQQRRLLLGAAARGYARRAQGDRGKERTRQHGLTHFFQNDRQIDQRQAGTAVLLGDSQAGPAQLGHAVPDLVGVAAVVLHHLAHVRHRTFLAQEIRGRPAEEVLFFAEAEIHGVPYFACRTRNAWQRKGESDLEG